MSKICHRKNCNNFVAINGAKFCSHSCSARYNNQKRAKIRFCQNCKKKTKNRTLKLFCNRVCKEQYVYKQQVENWLNKTTPINELYQNGRNYPPRKFIRTYLFELNNNSCQLCGWNKVNLITKKIPLQIHHIDGNCKNNVFENLQLLCPNCHSLTATYGVLNKGNSLRVDAPIV